MDVKNKTVSSRILKYRYQKLLDAGLDADYIYRCTGISEDEVNNKSTRISYPNYLRFNQFLALHGYGGLEGKIWEINIETLVRELGALPALCVNQPDAGSALNAYVRYRGLIGESDYLLCSQENEQVTIQFSGESFSRSMPEFYAGSALANFIILATILRFYLQNEAHQFDIELVHDPIFPADKYRRFFRGSVHFNQEENYMRFDASLLQTGNRMLNPALTDFLQQQVESEYDYLHSHSSFSALVRKQIISIERKDGMGTSVHDELCQRLGVSRWTLRRKLADEGYTFQSMVDEIRLERAKYYLRSTGSKISEISDRLGFSSQSAFTRFFHKQTDQCPSAFREKDQFPSES
ncbi:AraC family transcriptional regulator [Vibrio sp. HA2012]|uniref:AraC family transcriptional regulator n=1 Tax=Vibrio sp. HA2012 TaxID=1971595 RepID=UPI0012FE137A|nr:AraC family transcriptional regulator [Vibrio sp. HA2012]